MGRLGRVETGGGADALRDGLLLDVVLRVVVLFFGFGVGSDQVLRDVITAVRAVQIETRQNPSFLSEF